MFLIRHKKLSVLRIAKLVRKEHTDYGRILREANMIKDYKHTGIPVIYDIEEDNSAVCIIEEYIFGKALSRYVGENTMQLKDILTVAVKLCEIVGYLHTCIGIIHLDLKPANVIVSYDDKSDEYFVSIIDFDSSVLVYGSTDDNILYGTPVFCAPELYESIGGSHCSVSIQADIYSIGMLILYMINGGHMQSLVADTRSLCEQYSKSVGPVIQKCIRHNPNQRFESVEELRKELIRVANDEINSTKKTDIDKFCNIYVFGAKRSVGTTHCCFCICSFLRRIKRSAVYVSYGDSGEVSYKDIRINLLSDGIYEYRGIHILPYYGGAVDCTHSIADYEYRIFDCGIYSKWDDIYKLPEYIKETYVEKTGCIVKNVFVLVADCGYRQGDYSILEKADKDIVTIINHISGKDFYQYVKSSKARNCYRLPCIYDWNESSSFFEEAVCEILDINEEKKGSIKGYIKDWCTWSRKRRGDNTVFDNAGELLCECFKSKNSST